MARLLGPNAVIVELGSVAPTMNLAREVQEGRFRQAYPGFRVEVLDCDGSSAHGNTRLGTVRDSYYDDE